MKKTILFLLIIGCSATMMAQNVQGYVRCGTAKVAGVAISDGDTVVVTDSDGHYAFESKKRNGYVFCSIPRGYEATMADGFRPQFWQAFRFPTNTALSEYINFTLRAVQNDAYTLIIGADSHLANRTSDLSQFKNGYIERIREEKEAAPGRIYSMILGDLTWDAYWYARDYGLQDFFNTCKEYKYSVPLFPVIGNHDNDAAVPAGKECDFLASAPWRKIVCPNYYSFNLGRVHYVVLDDIYYKNEDTGESYNKGVVGSRNYDSYITQDQINWLKQDIALVNPDEPLVIALHIPVWRVRQNNTFETYSNLKENQSEQIAEMLKDFKQVHIITGHTHYNVNAHPLRYPNIMEHNIAAICATWWWTGKLTNHQVCKDGSPGGYSLWNVNGDKLKWRYHSIEKNGNLQMRIYDMNTVKEYFATNDVALKMHAAYPSRTQYADFGRNCIMVNVFAYDNDWKVEAFEGTHKRSVTRIVTEDPFHTIAYDIPRFKDVGSYTADFSTGKTTHLFRFSTTSSTTPVTVRVTDSFGNVYTQTIQRPHPFNLEMETLQTNDDPTGITPVFLPKGEGQTYDISGRRITSHRKGIFIKNGRKYLSR